MAFTKYTEDLNIIQSLSNLPNETDGLSADSLKAKFDEGNNLTQTFINGLIDELENEGAGKVGIHIIEGVSGNNIQSALESIKSQLNDATTGTILPRSLDGETLKLEAVTDEELATDAVTTAKVKNGAITNEKIASVAANKITGKVGGGQIGDSAVGTDNIINFSVNSSKIASGAVTDIKLAANAVTETKIFDSAVTAGKLAGGAIPVKIALNILADAWTGSASPYTAGIVISDYNITNNSKVDIQADATTLMTMIEDGVAGVIIKNDNGTLTAYAVGEKPTHDLDVQLTIEEVR